MEIRPGKPKFFLIKQDLYSLDKWQDKIYSNLYLVQWVKKNIWFYEKTLGNTKNTLKNWTVVPNSCLNKIMTYSATCQKSMVSCKTRTNTLDFADEFKNLEAAWEQENPVNLFENFIILR